jgi:hypothetical protein
MAAVKAALREAGVSQRKAANLAMRRDITPQRVRQEISRIAKCDDIDDKAAVLVARLDGKGKKRCST